MMKRFYYLFVFLSFILFSSQKVYGQASFFDAHVSKYGELEQVLGDKWDKIDSLIVHGPINEADFTTMWKCSFEGKLTMLNLEHAQIENNKIPTRALFKVDRQVIDDPRAYQGVVYLPIRHLILPEGIQEIGDFAFSRMRLEQVNLPKSLRKLGRSCFSSCHWLNTDPLIIPEGITSIPPQCFINCQCFKKLVLPSTLKTIEGAAFYNTRVEEANFPEGLEYIKGLAFEGSDLKKAILPSTLKDLSEFTFSMCPKLQEIKIPEGVTKIPLGFASWCHLLEEVNIPKSVTVIEVDAFGSDVKLKPIDLPEGLKRIEQDALWYCAIDSIVFPASLEYLGGGSCANWKYIKKIYSLAPNPPYCAEDRANPGKGPFHGYTPNDVPLYVPIGSGEKYRQAFGWNYFTNIIETDKFPTGIVSPKMSNNEQCKVYGRDGKLFIEFPNTPACPVRYSVYSIGGTMIEQGYLTASHTLQMPSRDTYIIYVGNAVYKILM
jgi:putative cell surface protein